MSQIAVLRLMGSSFSARDPARAVSTLSLLDPYGCAYRIHLPMRAAQRRRCYARARVGRLIRRELQPGDYFVLELTSPPGQHRQQQTDQSAD